jgi:hypothetical protein
MPIVHVLLNAQYQSGRALVFAVIVGAWSVERGAWSVEPAPDQQTACAGPALPFLACPAPGSGLALTSSATAGQQAASRRAGRLEAFPREVSSARPLSASDDAPPGQYCGSETASSNHRRYPAHALTLSRPCISMTLSKYQHVRRPSPMT